MVRFHVDKSGRASYNNSMRKSSVTDSSKGPRQGTLFPLPPRIVMSEDIQGDPEVGDNSRQATAAGTSRVSCLLRERSAASGPSGTDRVGLRGPSRSFPRSLHTSRRWHGTPVSRRSTRAFCSRCGCTPHCGVWPGTGGKDDRCSGGELCTTCRPSWRLSLMSPVTDYRCLRHWIR